MIHYANLDFSRRAAFSEDAKYRYTLLIRWSDNPVQAMIGLNPSTADHERNDATIARCTRRAHALGAGGLLMLNLFAFRSTNPDAMLKANDPYGEWRDPGRLIETIHADAPQLPPIAAWGNHGTHRDRSQEFLEACHAAGLSLFHFTKTKAGEPGHALYLPYFLQPIPL